MKINYNSMLIRDYSFLQFLRFSVLISLFYFLPLQLQAQSPTRFNIDVSHLNSTSLCANQVLSFKLTTRIYAGDPATSCPGLEFYLKNLRYRVEIGTLDTLWFTDIKDNGNIATIYTKNGGIFTVALGDIADADNDVLNTTAGANEATIDFCKDSENLPCTCGSTTTEGPCDATACPKTYGITDLTFNITYTIPNTAATGTYPVTAQETLDIYAGYASPTLVQANFCANYPASYQPARSFDVASCPVSICAGEEFTLTLPSGTLPGEWYKDNVATGNTTLTYIVTTPGNYKYQGVNPSGCAFSTCADATFVPGTCGSIGNYVWNDLNGDGLNNEAASAGINGVKVRLYKENVAGTDYVLADSMLTSNNASNPGYYLFDGIGAGNYKVQFVAPTGKNLTKENQAANVDNNSDADGIGWSGVIALGVGENDTTIDAGFINGCTVGNILYLCGNVKPADADAFDHGMIGYLQGLGNTITPALTQNVAGLGLYNPMTMLPTGITNLNAFDAIIISPTVEGSYSPTLIDSLRKSRLPILASDYWANADLGLSNNAGFDYQNDVHNGTSQVPFYNYVTLNPTQSYNCGVFWGDYGTNATPYLWLDATAHTNNKKGVYYAYEPTDAINNPVTGLPLNNHGRRVFYGIHANGIYENPTNGGAIPSPSSAWLNPYTHLTSYGKRYLDSALALMCTTKAPAGSIGNFVWNDIDGDGLQDAGELGINGVQVKLYQDNGSGTYNVIDSTTTATNGGNAGYYSFTGLGSWNYYVQFPTTTSGMVVSTQTTTAATDGNSDANTSTGNSPIFAIDIYGTGTAKDNPTIDAGYKLIPIITAIAGACDANSNQYSVTGTITGIFPATGQMLVNIAGEGSILYSTPFPSSPLSYSITGLISDAASKTVTITFTDAPALNTSVNYTAPAACITNTCVSGGAGVETYSYALPLSTTDIVNQAITLPKFNDMGGTRILEKVLITQKQSTITNGLLENTSATVDSFFLHLNTKGLLSMAGDTLLFADYDANYDNKELSGNVFVPTNGAYPAWLGDVNQPIGAGFVSSTLARMEVSSTVVTNDLPNFIDPRLNSGWVTNLTGDPTHDDDIWYISPLEMSKSASKLVTTSLASYVGTGNLNMLANADASLNFQGGGGNVVLDVRTKYTTTVTVTYYYCPAATIGNYVWNDTDGNGNQDVSESGINGVSVELYKETSAGSGSYTLSQTTTTANDGTNDGAYNFIVTESANYYVHFPTTANSSLVLSTQTITAATDGNSDANTSNGNSPIFAMDVNGIGTAKDNPTIDAGYKCNVSAAISGITCSNAANGQATALGTGGLAPYTYTWNTSPVQTTASVTNFALGSYIVTVKDANQCSDTAHLIIHSFPNSGISGPSSACALEDALFQATNPQVGNIYSWNFGSFATPATSTNSSETIAFGAAAVGTSQTISLTVTTAAGCTETYSVSVNVTPSVFANAGPDATICQGASSTLGGSPSGQTGSTYLWTPNFFLNNNTVANPLSTPPSTITYTLTTTLNGCVKTDQVTVTVDVNLNPIADAGADQSICAGQSVTIGGSPTATPSTNVFYSWSPATGLSATNIANPTANPSTTTTYQVIVINTLGCPDTDFVLVNVTPALNVTETHTNILCKGAATGSIDLTVTGGNGTTTYSWSNGATTQDLINVVAGNYSVTVTSGTCSQVLNISLTEPATILAANITAQVNVSTTGGANGSATVTAAGGTSPYTYTWTTSLVQYTATATGLTAGTYTVTVKDANGCIQTANVTIIEPATIGDFVWNDLDNDGIQDAGEPGVSGIIVTLYNNAGDPVQTMVTDAYGYYSFTTSAGTYTIGFSLPVDYGFSPKGTGTATDSDVNLATGRTDAIVLNNGDNRTDIDAGVHFISIITASLGDFVWLDSTPNGVQDGTEQGVAGVLVTLYNGTTNATIQSTITNGEGYYFFTNLTPADYYVGFALPAGYTFVTKDAGLDDVDSDVATSGANFGKTIVTTISGGENDLSWDAGIVKTAAGTASVGDFVWNDIHHDGIQDTNEPGIAGVTVTLKDPSGTVIATTTTDALGGYIFNGLAAGTYYITFSTPSGYTPSPTDASGEDDTDSDAGLGGNTGLFTLISNEVRTNIDAGFYQTSPAGTAQIGDFVWYDTNQNGIQDLGEAGVPGVTVTLYNAAGNPIATTVTNNDGNYIFTDLAAGTYTIGFSNLPEGYEFSPSGQGTASTGSDADSRGLTASITLSAGQINTDIDAGLLIQEGNSGKGSLGNYVWLDLDNDNIQDNNESGVANVTVNLLNGTTNAVLKSTKTDVSGYYIFTGLDAGTYKVEFTSLPTNLTLVSQDAGSDDEKDSDANASTGITATIALAQGQNRLDVDAGLRSSAGTGSIGDFVWMDTNGNGLQDIGEPGIGGIGVVLYDGSGNVLAVTTTNSEGFYVFGGLPAGTYQVGFVGMPTGLTFTTQTTGTANGSDANPSTGTSPTFTLLAGETKTDIDAGLQSTRAMIGNYVWLDDNKDGVQDATEKGVAGVTVTLYNASNTALASTITDANGFYLFPNVTPATGYTLGFATIPDGLSFTAKDAASGATADEIDSDVNTATGKTNAFSVAAGDVNLSFDAGLITPNLASLNGYVWFDLNKDGIQDLGEVATSGVTVTLYNAAGTVVIATAITDANGNYLFDNVAPGTYSVGFGTLPTDVNGILYAFTSPNQGGDDAIDSDVNAATGQSLVTYTIADGEHKEAADAGLIRQVASIGDNVWLDANENGIQDSGEPGVGGITVTLYNSAGTAIASTTTSDTYGNYLFADLAPGSYTVGFSLPIDYVFTVQNTSAGTSSTDSDPNITTGRTNIITVAAGDNRTDIDAGIYFEINTPSGSLGDYVWLDGDGNGVQDGGEMGVSNVTVTLYDGTGTVLGSTVTDGDGYYHFTNVVAGNSYQVGFTLPAGYTYTLANQGGNDLTDSDALTSGVGFGKTAVFVLNASAYDMTIDAGLVAIDSANASVGDFVWNDLNQNGVQDPGEPGQAGISIKLLDANGVLVATTTTDVFGKYIFTDVADGSYQIEFGLPSGYLFSPANQLTNDEADSDANTSTGRTPIFFVSSGDKLTDLDAGIYESPATGTAGLGNYVWYDSDQNGLQDTGEPGVAGVIVTLFNSLNGAIATTTTDNLGYYTFVNLAAGNYQVQFSNLPNGRAFTTANVVGNDATDSDADATTGMSHVITLANGQYDPTIDAGIILSSGNSGNASLGDFVWNDVNNNGIQDTGEPGVSGIKVKLTNILTNAVDSTTTNATGYYIFNSLAAGQYELTFTNVPSGYNIVSANAGTDTGKDSDVNPATGKTTTITLASGDANLTIDMGIHNPSATASLGDQVWNDKDKDGVQDAGEVGVAGLTVTLYDANGAAIRTTVTNQEGNYLFAGLIPGIYAVGISNLPTGFQITKMDRGGDDTKDSDVNPLTGKSNPISLASGQNNLDMDAGIYSNTRASIGNYVWYDTNINGIQDGTETGVVGVTVTLVDNLGTEVGSRITDADGFYYFSNVLPESYSLTFTTLPADYTFTTANTTSDANDSDVDPNTGAITGITVAAGDVNYTFDAGIIPPQLGGLTGYVWYDYKAGILATNNNGIQNSGEKPVNGVTVELYDNTGNLLSTTVTAPNGIYYFDNLIPANYEIRFVKPIGTQYAPADQGSDNSLDSDVANMLTGSGGTYTVIAGQRIEAADAGLVPPANITGFVFRDGCVNQSNTANGIYDTNGGLCNDTPIPGVWVLLIDEATNTVLRRTQTTDPGIYIFRNVEVGRDYKVAFEPTPQYCATCDFTEYNFATAANDTTDSDVNINELVQDGGKSFAKSDLITGLQPLETRPDIDAGYRLPGSTFPVELLYFKAELQGKDGDLTWETSQELNSDHFDIERSLDNGSTYEYIGKVKSAGNSTTARSYEFVDPNVVAVAKDKIYYRLKMVDIDNSYKYSNTVVLKLNTEGSSIYANVYPNPATEAIFVDYQLYGVKTAEMRFVNALGQTIYIHDLKGNSQMQTAQFDLRDWSAGVYFIHISTESTTITKKFVKE